MINGFNFKKKFGQNFITDKNLLSAIVKDAGVQEDTQVLEIGAGAGTLTEQLGESASRVVSVEIDKELKPYLDLVCDKNKNVEVIFGDFLELSREEIESKFDKPYRVVANLPYYITTPIIFRFLEEGFNVKSLTLMVQKEVAERFCAEAGTSEYGAVSVMLQSFADLKITRIVPRTLFYPVPNVDSAVIHIEVNLDKYKIDDREKLAKVVKASFAYRRKTLCNCLQMSFDLDRPYVESVLEGLNLNKNIRGEKLTIEEFIALSCALNID